MRANWNSVSQGRKKHKWNQQSFELVRNLLWANAHTVTSVLKQLPLAASTSEIQDP